MCVLVSYLSTLLKGGLGLVALNAGIGGVGCASQDPGCEVNGTFHVTQTPVGAASGSCSSLPRMDTFVLSSGVDEATTLTAYGGTLGGNICTGSISLTSACTETDTECESAVGGDILNMDFTFSFTESGFTGTVSLTGSPSGCRATYAETGVRAQ